MLKKPASALLILKSFLVAQSEELLRLG